MNNIQRTEKELGVFNIGWDVNYLKKPETVPHKIFTALERVVNEVWLPAFLKTGVRHPWGLLEERNIVSPIIRAEFPAPTSHVLKYSEEQLEVWVQNHVLEIESRPGGNGIFQHLCLNILGNRFSEDIRERQATAFSLCDCRSIIHIGEKMQDEEHFANSLGIPYLHDSNKAPSGFAWVRHDTNYKEHYSEEYLAELEPLSAVAVRSDGEKDYLIAMGMAQYLSDVCQARGIDLSGTDEKRFEKLWERSFAIKPRQSTWAEKVGLFNAELTGDKRNKAKTKIKRLLKDHGVGMFLYQDFLSPRKDIISEKTFNTIFRPFLYWNGERYKTFDSIATTSLEQQIVHGTKEAKFGLAVPE